MSNRQGLDPPVKTSKESIRIRGYYPNIHVAPSNNPVGVVNLWPYICIPSVNIAVVSVIGIVQRVNPLSPNPATPNPPPNKQFPISSVINPTLIKTINPVALPEPGNPKPTPKKAISYQLEMK